LRRDEHHVDRDSGGDNRVGKSSPILGVLGAWALTIVAVAYAVGVAIEHPEYLSMPLIPFALLVSVIFIGLPLGFGLLVVQRPAFDRSLQHNGSFAWAWLTSIAANAIYAAFLTLPLMFLFWVLGNEVTVFAVVWFALVLVICSTVTSIIWLTFNALILKAENV
jgi:hypothetical protein